MRGSWVGARDTCVFRKTGNTQLNLNFFPLCFTLCLHFPSFQPGWIFWSPNASSSAAWPAPPPFSSSALSMSSTRQSTKTSLLSMPWLLLTLCSLWLSLSLLWLLHFLSTSQDDLMLYFEISFRSVQTRPSSNGFWSVPQVQWPTEFSVALRPRLRPLHVHHSNLSLTSSCRCSCSPGGLFFNSKDIPSCSYFYATAQPQEWTFLLLSTLAMVSSLHFKERHFLQNTSFSLVKIKSRLALGSPSWFWLSSRCRKWPNTQENGW